MVAINALLSSLPPAVFSADRATSPTDGGTSFPQPNGQARTSVDGDSFEQGQWWKNRSQAGAGEAESGNWRVKVAKRVYGAQALPKDSALSRGEAAGQNVDAAAGEAMASRQGLSGDGDGEKDRERTALTDRKPNGEALSQAEKLRLMELRKADVDIRAHERAHLVAAGPYARSGASYQYEQGPDGKKYAVSGEVLIDTTKENEPEQTISKMLVVRSAALAPASPSPQDRRVASKASTVIGDARVELRLMQLAAADQAREDAVREVEAVKEARAAKSDEVENAGSVVELNSSRRTFTVNSAAKLMKSNSAQFQYGVDLVV